jgi:hypothetical protein
MLDLGTMIHILDRCFFFEHAIPNETLHSSIWAHHFWYQALDSGTALSEDSYSRICLILNELLTKVRISSAAAAEAKASAEATAAAEAKAEAKA